MINVLHLRDTDRVCGPGKTILETCTRIDSSRFRLAIGLFIDRNEKETDNGYWRAATERGIEVIPLRTRGRFDPSAARQIAQLARSEQFDLIHSHEYKSDLLTLAGARTHSAPIVSTAHGWITNSFKSKLMIGAGKRALRYFDRVIAVSPAIRDELQRVGVPQERLRLIYNAIVMENYRPQDYRPGQVREAFGLPDEAVLIGNVGRLSPEKGQADFLQAAARVLPEFPSAYFVLVGDGADRPRLERLADTLGIREHVLFTGYQQDVRPIFRDLDYLALTSHTEGFPNVLLESLCMDTPVLATAVGGVPAIVSDRETGHLVPAHKPEHIAERLLEMLQNPEAEQRMAAAGKTRIVQRFEFGQRVRRLQQLYAETLGARTSLSHVEARRQP